MKIFVSAVWAALAVLCASPAFARSPSLAAKHAVAQKAVVKKARQKFENLSAPVQKNAVQKKTAPEQASQVTGRATGQAAAHAASHWRVLGPAERKKMEAAAKAAYDKMTPAERAKAVARAKEEWEHMTPQERKDIQDQLNAEAQAEKAAPNR